MLQTGRLVTVLLAGATATMTASAADPALMNLVMPDAKVLAGVNSTTTRISPFGQFILSKLSTATQDPHFAALGFNPFQDVNEILAASSGDPTHPGGLILATGNFPVDKITAAVAGQKNVQVQAYDGATLLVQTGSDNSQTVQGIAFLGTTTAIAGDLASVKAAVDRKTNPSSIDPALAVKVNQLSGSHDEWFISSTGPSSLIPPAAVSDSNLKGPAAQVLPLLKSIQSFDGGVKLSDSISFNAEALASDANNAAALQAVVKLGLALVSSANTNNDPNLAQLVQLLQSMQVTLDGSTVQLALSVPESQVEAFLNAASAQRADASRTVRPPHPSGEARHGK
jgi:hypothetical protein